MEKAEGPLWLLCTLAIETHLICSYSHQWLSSRSLNMTGDDTWHCSKSIPNVHLSDFMYVPIMINLQLLHSFLMDIMLLLISEENRKTYFQTNFPACRSVCGSTVLLRVHRYAAVLEHTGLKASLEVFITVWVSVCKHPSLPLYVSTKIPWPALSSEQWNPDCFLQLEVS